MFDAESAEHLCAFVELWPHVEGRWANAGETIHLSDWQAFALGQINGWRHMDSGLRRFRTAYIEVPRKNGKTTLLAPVGLYFLTVDGESGAKVFSAASNTDQARIVFDIARTMARNGEAGGAPLDRQLDLIVEEHKIKTSDPAAVFRPVAAQTKSQDGKNPHLAIIDELHEHAKRDVWDAMASAMGARDQPLMIAITTAGHNTSGVCFEQRRYVERLLTNVQVDDSYFGLIFEADEGDDPGDPETWHKANPNLGISKSLQYLKDEWAKAQASPAAMGEFMRKHLDIWTSIGASALNLEKWMAAEDSAMTIESFAGCKAYIGVDLAIRHDFADVVVVIPDGREFNVFAWHFLPEAQVQAPGNEHIEGWARDGWVYHTPGATLDLNVVESLVMRLCGKSADGWEKELVADLDVQQVIYDPTFASQMAATWAAAGIDIVELAPRARNFNEPFQRLIGLVEDGRVKTNADPVMRWMASNTMMKQVAGGDYVYPTKAAPEDKIDGIAALINAIWPLGQAEQEQEAPSVYESRGLLFV